MIFFFFKGVKDSCIFEGREKEPLKEGGSKERERKGRYIGGVPKESEGNGLSGMGRWFPVLNRKIVFPLNMKGSWEDCGGTDVCGSDKPGG